MSNQDHSALLESLYLVLGVLLGTFIGLAFMVRMLFIESGTHLALEDPEVQAEIATRIEPVGNVLLTGSDELASAAVQPVVVPVRVEAPLTGPQVYNQACFACHTPPGVAGAPALGDAAAWAGRVEQGMDTLIQHALQGFEGENGIMPPKGGQVQLSDDEVIAAIEYMLAQLNQ